MYVVMFVDLKGSTKPGSYYLRDKRIEEYFKIAYQELFNKQEGIFSDKADSIKYRQYLGDGFLCAFPETECVFVLRLALCLQILAKWHNGSMNKEEPKKEQINLKIGIEIDFLKEVTDLLSDSLLFNGSDQCKPKAFWGDALIDAQRICSFAEKDHILVGPIFYDKINKETLDKLGLARTDKLDDRFFEPDFNYDKHGEERKILKFRISDLSRSDIQSILRNPSNFDRLIPSDIGNNIELGTWRKLENNGITVQLANENPILKEYYKGLIANERLQQTSHTDGTHEFVDKDGDKIYKYLFDNCDYYRSTTTLLPSIYNKSVPNNDSYFESLLNFHRDLVIKKSDSHARNYRIIVNNKEELKHDYLTYKDEWQRFLGAHKNQGVGNNEEYIIEVKWINTQDVNRIRQNTKFQDSNDVGAWFSNEKVEYCAEWNIDPQKSDEGKFLLRPTDKYSDQIRRFLEELERQSEEISSLIKEADDDRTKLYDQDLFKFTRYIASNWEAHVFPEKRKKILKLFLEEILEDQFGKDYNTRSLSILDSSSGIGCDADLLKEMCPLAEVYLEVPIDLEMEAANWLKKRGRRVSNRRDSNPDIVMNSTPWDLFEDKYKRERFDLILVVGNFISRGRNLEKIKAHLERFKRLLKQKGILIVDHRNYDRLDKIQHFCKEKEKCFSEFRKLHQINNGLYLGPSNEFYMWPIEFSEDRNGKYLTVQYGEQYNEPSKDRTMKMSSFSTEEFRNIIKNVFGYCPKPSFDYPLNSTVPIKDEEYIAVNNASFLIYVIENR
jgi:hypothetical protein